MPNKKPCDNPIGKKSVRNGRGDDSDTGGEEKDRARYKEPEIPPEEFVPCPYFMAATAVDKVTHRCRDSNFETFRGSRYLPSSVDFTLLTGIYKIADRLLSWSDHIQNVHIRPIQCMTCTARFGRMRDLHRHRRYCRKQDSVPSTVPQYVAAFSQQVKKCNDIASLDQILFRGGRKQYDYVDNTDGM